MSEKKENIVKNDSAGYGYNYASLSDIAKQGFNIPKMKTETDQFTQKEYVFYFDKDINEWIRGAQVVVPENIVNASGKNKMNSAQLYGSALTYARRYTTLMALQLACEDDKALENTEERKASDKQVEMIVSLYDQENIDKILSYYAVSSLSELTLSQASQVISKKKGNNENH